MNGGADLARFLYVELRAFSVEVRLEEDAWGEGVLDYGVTVDGLRSLPEANAGSLTRRIRANENDLVRLLASTGDPALRAIRGECDRG